MRGAIMAFEVLPASRAGLHFCVTGRDATWGSTVLLAMHIRDEVRLCEGRGRGAAAPFNTLAFKNTTFETTFG